MCVLHNHEYTLSLSKYILDFNLKMNVLMYVRMRVLAVPFCSSRFLQEPNWNDNLFKFTLYNIYKHMHGGI